MLVSNIDIQDSKSNTVFPFIPGSTMMISDMVLPQLTIPAISVYCTQDIKLPVHIGLVTYVSDTAADLSICAEDGVLVATARLDIYKMAVGDTTTILLFSRNNTIRGFIVLTNSGIQSIVSCARIHKPVIKVDKEACTLLPSCIQAIRPGHALSLDIGDYSTTQDITIYCKNYLHNETSASSYSISLYSDYRVPSTIQYASDYKGVIEAGITHLVADNVVQVNGVPYNGLGTYKVRLGSRPLYVRHSMTSNLRVLIDGGTIKFSGVLDES